MTAETTPIADVSIADGNNVEIVHAKLRRAIIDGQLPGGAEISQVQLAREHGVSRTVLREALRLLQREGFIEQAEPNRRVRVARVSVADMEEIYAARVGLESLGIQLSVPRFTSDDLAELDAELAKMSHFAARREYDRWQEPHRRLHRALVKHAGTRICALVEGLADHAERHRRYYAADAPGAWSFGMVEHEAIVEACKSGDPQEAAEALVAHLAHTVFSVIDMVSPSYDAALLRDAMASVAGERGHGRVGGAGELGEGLELTHVDELAPYSFDTQPGRKPDLPARLSFANVDTMNRYGLLAEGMRKACRDRGLAFAEVNAHGDVRRNLAQIQALVQRGTGGMMVIPLGPRAQDGVRREALKAGGAVFGLSTAPATCQLIGDQHRVGTAQGTAAAAWIRRHLDGRAKIAYFNLDAVSPALVARHVGVMEALRSQLPQVRFVDQGLGMAQVSPDGGFKLVSTLLRAHRDIDVIMGPDAFIMGAAKAVTACRDRRVRYISGVDGEASVMAEIQAGGLIKATVAFPWTLLGYAVAQFTADWLEGRSIPQAIIVREELLASPAAIEAFQRKQADPAAHWTTDCGTLLGSISYETRHDWLRRPLSTRSSGLDAGQNGAGVQLSAARNGRA